MSSQQTSKRILICDDDSLFQAAVQASLGNKYQVDCVSHTDQAKTALSKKAYSIMLLDIQMRTPEEGLDALPELREANPDLAVIITSGFTDYDYLRRAMQLGAADFLRKDFHPNELIHTLDRVFTRLQNDSKNKAKDNELEKNQNQHLLIGNSPFIQQLKKQLEKIKTATSMNVLITGETGTGKEVVARQLRMKDSTGFYLPFIAMDSATIQQSTAESILFGHEKGAFTGADQMKKGIFEDANGGIVYFDELGNMSLDIQAKLLRVLQEKEVTRLGSNKNIPVDFRIVAATNLNLDEVSQKGEFRDDLLQRINVIPIHLIPLRERKEDIPLLVEHFLSIHQKGTKQYSVTDDAMKCFTEYNWPGNIRELSNVIAYIVTMSEYEEIDICDLPPKLRDIQPTINEVAEVESDDGKSFYDKIQDFEKHILITEYKSQQGNIRQLALKLGMDRSHLYTKLKMYGIHTTKRM